MGSLQAGTIWPLRLPLVLPSFFPYWSHTGQAWLGGHLRAQPKALNSWTMVSPSRLESKHRQCPGVGQLPYPWRTWSERASWKGAVAETAEQGVSFPLPQSILSP